MKFKSLIASVLCMSVAVCTFARQPKYVFLFIGDGMGMGPVVAAETYNRTVLNNDMPLTMMQLPVVGWCMTYSASSLITDSAAAGTALSTGSKTCNGMLGVDADTIAVPSVAKTLKDNGYGIGIITSVAPDDATPGAFYAHVPHRGMHPDIDRDMARSGYDFVAGGDIQGAKDKDGKQNDVLKTFKGNKVNIVRGMDELSKFKTGKVLLLNRQDCNRPWEIGYTIDSVDNAMSLPQMTQVCLNHLEKNTPDRFFMMVEGGLIDHALHANDGGAAVKEILSFDASIAVALDFYKQHPDETLIVVTADHDTGGLAISKIGSNSKNYLQVIDNQRISKELFNDYCKTLLKSRSEYSWEDMKNFLTEKLGLFANIPVSKEQEKRLKEQFESTFELRNSSDQKTLYANFNSFSVEVFNLVNNAAGLYFTTTGHSGNAVPLFAIGVGADLFKGFNNNIDIPKHIRTITGVK